MVPEDKKAQARKALKVIYILVDPMIIIQKEFKGIVIENIAVRDFTVMEQSSIVVEWMKLKQSPFIQDLFTI